LPTSLDGTAVRIDGRAAAIFFVGPGQLNVQVPDTATNGPVTVEVETLVSLLRDQAGRQIPEGR
jgi:uncharacterized protein (TIGR03437 family)